MSTILVADDDRSFQSLMRTLLELEGYKVRMAGDGRAALREISEDRPDAMLLDVMMPELDGVGVLECLQQVQGLESLPVIVLTGDKSLLIGARCLALGARHVVHKPLDPGELIGLLAGLLVDV